MRAATPSPNKPPPPFARSPVTAIFAHRSDEVWTLRLDNGDSLGETANHPIYSTTHGAWRPAGELLPGERLLSLNGETALASKAKLPGTHTVYNLEVRELHNFLVGKEGVVVNNNYFCNAPTKLLLTNHKGIFKNWIEGFEPKG